MQLSGVDECDEDYQRYKCFRESFGKQGSDMNEDAKTKEIAKICHEQYPEVPDYVVGNVTDKDIFLKAAGKENIPGVRCFQACLFKKLIPEVLTENGEFNLENLIKEAKDQDVKRFTFFTGVKCFFKVVI